MLYKITGDILYIRLQGPYYILKYKNMSYIRLHTSCNIKVQEICYKSDYRKHVILNYIHHVTSDYRNYVILDYRRHVIYQSTGNMSYIKL